MGNYFSSSYLNTNTYSNGYNSSISNINGTSTINLNGKIYTTTGNNITVQNNTIYVDGKKLDTENTNDQNQNIVYYPITINIEGDAGDVSSTTGTINVYKNAQNVESTSGQIIVKGNVGGNANNVSGSISANKIVGRVSTVSGMIN